jgi:hypothetical protein
VPGTVFDETDNVVVDLALAAPNDVFTPNAALVSSRPRGRDTAETSSKASPNTTGATLRSPRGRHLMGMPPRPALLVGMSGTSGARQ